MLEGRVDGGGAIAADLVVRKGLYGGVLARTRAAPAADQGLERLEPLRGCGGVRARVRGGKQTRGQRPSRPADRVQRSVACVGQGLLWARAHLDGVATRTRRRENEVLGHRRGPDPQKPARNQPQCNDMAPERKTVGRWAGQKIYPPMATLGLPTCARAVGRLCAPHSLRRIHAAAPSRQSWLYNPCPSRTGGAVAVVVLLFVPPSGGFFCSNPRRSLSRCIGEG